MKTLTLLLTIAGIGIASADNLRPLDVRQLIEQRWLLTVGIPSQTWTCEQADAATIQAAYEGRGTFDLSSVLNDDPRPESVRGPIKAAIPLVAAGQ